MFLETSFWVCAGVLYLIQYLPFSFDRLTVFGIFNLIALSAIFDVTVGVAALVFSLIVWLFVRNRRKNAASTALASAFIPILISVLLLLILYKVFKQNPALITSICEKGNCVSGIIMEIFITLSFSYAALRCYDFVKSASEDEGDTINILALSGYLFPFFMLIAGPIAHYKKFVNSILESPPAPSLMRLIESISIISTGLFYKYFVAEGLRIYAYGVSGVVQYEGWFDSAFLLVYLFFDFAGYSLVALGIGKACFIHTPINFKKPFFSRSITEFWERWHISLGEFVRRNIYMPLQAGLVRKYGIARSQSVAFVTMIISFGLVGLWHKISVSFVLWGVFLGVVMGLEKIIRDKFVRKYGTKNKKVNLTVKVIGPVYVFSVISTSLSLVINEVF